MAAVAVLCITLFLLWSMVAAAAAKNNGGGGVQLWCVAKNNADDGALQTALDWACSDPPAGGVDCATVREGGVCFQPDDLQFHASFAFNEYYLRRSEEAGSCDFAGNAALTQLDPSRSMANVDAKCKFPSSLAVSNGSFMGSAYDMSSVGLKLTPHWAQVISFLMPHAVLGLYIR